MEKVVMSDENSKSPEVIGRSIINDLLSRDEFMFYHVENVHAIHYAEACAGYGALRLAGLLNDKKLISKLRDRYDIELASETTPDKIINTANHVDANVYGILPLEIYLQTNERIFLNQGMELANKQWENPLPNGMTNQTRYWVDDIYMIGSLQVQAFNATNDELYLNRASLEIDAYLAKLQQANGLFYHGENAKFFWGRGNGWVAAGLALLFSYLSKKDIHYKRIESSFIKMTDSLKKFQADDGMWRQLVDKDFSWKETSCSAMFAFAFCLGVKKGILPRDYENLYLKTWNSLTNYMENGRLKEICTGTGQSTDINYYLERPKVAGDLHGQAAMLWFCHAMLLDQV